MDSSAPGSHRLGGSILGEAPHQSCLAPGCAQGSGERGGEGEGELSSAAGRMGPTCTGQIWGTVL